MELSQSPADKQQEEIEALRSIFEDDFLPPPPKGNAWGVKVGSFNVNHALKLY